MSGDAAVGVSDHGGWAVLVTATEDGGLLDRRRVELVEAGLPAIPHHVEAQSLRLDEAVALIERVRLSAGVYSKLAFEALEATLPGRIGSVALRRCPELPPTVAERIADYLARNVADWVMYRRALAAAAEARGWAVCWYDPKAVLAAAGGAPDIRKRIGPPWNADHKLALAAALACLQQKCAPE